VSKLGLGRHVLKKARMRPEKEGRKKGAIGTESRMIRSSTKRKNDRFERAKR
jgi:hypothetical protein